MEDYKDMIENAIEWALNNKNNENYLFKCLAFVEDAYEEGNSIEMFGGSTAKESADIYGVDNKTEPIKGSFVFYSTTGKINGIEKDWGHVGLCIGDNKIIHTWDIIRIDDYKDILNLKGAPGWSRLEYLGWTKPEIFLRDHVKLN